MRIRAIHLKSYKRFADLRITDIPETARLVILIGPNGSGKSTIFDAFLLRARAAHSNYQVSPNELEYYERSPDQRRKNSSTSELASRVDIQFHGDALSEDQMQTAFYMRTAYRHEADFHTINLQRPPVESSFRRFARITDPDQAVSENYSKMTFQLLARVRDTRNQDQNAGALIDESEGVFRRALERLFYDPPLELQDLDELGEGTFRFTKGDAKDFQYLNLSGGEKAAFDLLLDIFVKRADFHDAVYCVDEPELHLATALHGAVLDEILEIMPQRGQLWLATHSIGFVRRAYELQQERPSEVAFLDFSGQNFDATVTLQPVLPTPAFWKSTYQVALDNLAGLIAPEQVVLCEGGNETNVHGHDAQIYGRIFRDQYPNTIFLTIGPSVNVQRGERFVAMLRAVASAIDIRRVRDRDDMTDDKRKHLISNGISVLSRREIENYLYDIAVIETFLRIHLDDEHLIATAKSAIQQSIASEDPCDGDFKGIAKDVLDAIKQATGIQKIGDVPADFEVNHLAHALSKTSAVFNELERDVFG